MEYDYDNHRPGPPYGFTTIGPVNVTNEERPSAWVLDLTWDDATWIITASFIIFTMQTGKALNEIIIAFFVS